MKNTFTLLGLFFFAMTLTACSIFGSERTHRYGSTSLVKFLHPDGNIPADVQKPVLNLPLRVGLAFVPASRDYGAISQSSKTQLLNNIKSAFNSKPYINEIVIIPDAYLNANRGYTSLEAVKQAYQLDVIALVSYDQIVKTRDNLLAIGYITIAGSYIFPGSHHKSSTFVDLALIDIDTRQILFRAAGDSTSKSVGAVAYAENAYDRSLNRDIAKAMQLMQANFDTELVKFEERLRARDPNDNVIVKHREGYSGSVNLSLLALLFVFVGFNLYMKKRNESKNT